MFKLARLTDYAVVLLLDLSRFKSGQTAMSLSSRTAIPLPTVQKILKQLMNAEDTRIIESQRGKNGGYRLSAKPEGINLADILRTMEGDIALTACVDGAEGHCIVEQVCSVRGRWDMVNLAVKEALSSLTLADMMTAELSSLPFQVETSERDATHGN